MTIVALVVSPLLLMLAQAPFDHGPLAVVALVPWLIAAERATFPGAALLGLAVGTLYAGAAASWIFEALRSLGGSAPSALVGWTLTSVWTQGLPFLAIGVAAHALRARSEGLRVIAVASLFFAIETIQSRLPLGLPLGLLGHTQGSVLGVAQLAVVGGVPLVSALVVAVNQAIACAITARNRAAGRWRLALALSVAWLSLAVLGLPLAQSVRLDAAVSLGEPLRLLLVQPNIPHGHRWAADLQTLHFERVAAYTEEALRAERARGAQIDAVLWPENLITRPLDSEIGTLLRTWTARLGVPVVTGLVRAPRGDVPDTARSSILWLAPDGETLAERDKAVAIPVLESSQRGGIHRWLAGAFGNAASQGIHIEEAPESRPLRGPFSAAAVLCFEALFPRVVASVRDADSRVILNLADDGWVPGSTATRQLTTAVRFRAIEQRLPLVRVAHGGLSAVFDPYGDSILELPLYSAAHAVIELRPSPPPAVSEKALLILLPSTAFGVVWCASRALQRRRPPRTTGEFS